MCRGSNLRAKPPGHLSFGSGDLAESAHGLRLRLFRVISFAEALPQKSRELESTKSNSREYRSQDEMIRVRHFHTTARLLSAHSRTKRTTIQDIHSLHQRNEKITVITAYDYLSAQLADSANPEMILVGDSLAMVALGYEDTNELPFDEFLYHCKAVSRGTRTGFIIADMPFGSYESSTSKAVDSAIQLISKGRANAVKLEGGSEITETIKTLTKLGIPVMGHVGLTPQRLNSLGGFKVQGRSLESAQKVLEDALRVQEAGAFSIVLEAIPHRLASLISDKLDIPTIGIGAGNGTSGQVLVQTDLCGLSDGHTPKFVKKFANARDVMVGAMTQYVQEVKRMEFPQTEVHTYKIKDEVIQQLIDSLE